MIRCEGNGSQLATIPIWEGITAVDNPHSPAPRQEKAAPPYPQHKYVSKKLKNNKHKKNGLCDALQLLHSLVASVGGVWSLGTVQLNTALCVVTVIRLLGCSHLASCLCWFSWETYDLDADLGSCLVPAPLSTFRSQEP